MIKLSKVLSIACDSSLIMREDAGLRFGGEGGIRTHVQVYTYHLISSQRRYGHFGTSPSVAHYIQVAHWLPE
jgi:hypothetical protein